MTSSLTRFGPASPALAATVLAFATGCGWSGGGASASAACPSPSESVAGPRPAASGTAEQDLVIVGRIVTMDEPAEAEAVLIAGGLVACVGSRDEVLARAGEGVPVLDIGPNVAYPGFIDAHAHWIGDRGYYEIGSATDATEAALSRGWTSISEQWVNPERLAELESMAAEDALPIRVDAYLALNEPNPAGAHLGDWYADRVPGPVGDRLRVQGLKIHLDIGWGSVFLWDSAELAETIRRADEAGWQVSVHTVSTEAHEIVLDALEAAIGPSGPNPLHHRLEHSVQVTDEHLARMVAMDLAAAIHLDGGPADWVLEPDYLGNLGDDVSLLARWRDMVDAGLRVAGATDTPWVYPGFALTDTVGRPMDQVAGGMDGRGLSNLDTPAWVLDQLLTAEQGLRAVTLDAAYALGDETRRGHRAPGALADITILSADLTEATPDEIRAMEVVATIVGGVIEHCADNEVCGRD